MIDRVARRKYAELVRQFISGRMTNDEYEDKFEAIESLDGDPAVYEIFSQVWLLYDDLTTHKMNGRHHLDRRGRRQIAQAVLFLQSDNEYQWPITGMWGLLIFPLLPICGIIALAMACSFTAYFVPILCAAACLCGATTAFALLKSRQEHYRWQKTGETEAWPFRTRADSAEAKRHPRLLAGRR